MQSLIVALVFTRFDYGSATLAGVPKQLMDRLQSVQNAAARLIFNACRCCADYTGFGCQNAFRSGWQC